MNLEKILAKFLDLNIIPYIGIEYEFYFKNFNDKNLTLITKLLADKFLVSLKEESGAGQFELIIGPDKDIFSLIKKLCEAKNFLLNFAHENNSNILFATKPFHNLPSCAMHVNISLTTKDVPIYEIPQGVVNDYLIYSIGGLCEFMLSSMLIFFPQGQDYVRLNSNIDCPSTISWGINNRSTAIRIPSKGDNRIEHRLPCITADPENVIMAILAAIYHGITKKINAPNPIYGIANDSQYKLTKLPNNINKARTLYDSSFIDDL